MQKRILDILQNTQKVIIGKERVTKLLLTALLAGQGKQDLPKHWLPVSELNSEEFSLHRICFRRISQAYIFMTERAENLC